MQVNGYFFILETKQNWVRWGPDSDAVNTSRGRDSLIIDRINTCIFEQALMFDSDIEE